MTTLAELRAAFWRDHPEYAPERRTRKRQNDYRADIRCAFVDWIDHQHRGDLVSDHLAQRATL